MASPASHDPHAYPPQALETQPPMRRPHMDVEKNAGVREATEDAREKGV